MDEKMQNACLMTTCFDDETGEFKLVYIPLNVDISVVEFFIKNGTCTNNVAVSFNLEETVDEFWTHMWNELEGSCE